MSIKRHFDKYIMRQVQLGSGRNYVKGWINIDINPKRRPDIVRDLNKGLPFDDNSVDEIYAEHFLEHVEDIHFVMYEIWRVLKKEGKVMIIVPIGKGWLNSPEHKIHFDEHSDVFFTIWNDPETTGYNFKLIDKRIIRAKVNDLGEDSMGFGDELHIRMEAIK